MPEAELSDVGGALAGAVVSFGRRLRDTGVGVSMAEMIDATAAIRHINPFDRQLVRAALAATLVKRPEDMAVFDAWFERFFQPVAGPRERPHTHGARTADPGSDRDEATDLERLLSALSAGDDDDLRDVATWAVDRHAGLEGGGDASEGYYRNRVLRGLDLPSALRLAARRRDETEGDSVERWLEREEVRRRASDLQQAVLDEIRRRLLEERRLELEDDGVRHLEEVEFGDSTPAQRREMRRLLQPLARKLAARITQRRRHRRRGRPDIRRTIRRSLATGGVPIDIAHRHPHITKPDLFVLCDVSGSVAEFADFTIALLGAVSEEFSRVRSFVFVDGVAEVTDLVRRSNYQPDIRQLLRRPGLSIGDGRSDYDATFRQFWEGVGASDLNRRTTVLIAGDARTNYHPTGVQHFRAISERARAVYWLNPEPAAEWDQADSQIGAYARFCTSVFEVRNLRQLARCVEAIA